MVELKQRVNLINKIHLFNGLKEEQLAGIAVKFQEREFPANKVIFKQGDKPDGFYIVYKGRVKVTRPASNNEERVLIWLTAADYFGEEALFENRLRSATITAMEDTILLFLTRAHFEELLVNYAKLKPNFQVAIKSHKLARATNFNWLGPKEVIYFIARRHKLRLYQALVIPALALLVPLVCFLLWALTGGSAIPLAFGVITLVADAAWIVWRIIDWSNDYYIVTNQRVIWLEKVVGVYDSREEAPLSSILSVNVETDQLGRMLDFGNVIVKTFVGALEFDYVDHPNQAADMIREYWERIKSFTTVSQKDIMRNTIREKLGLPVEKKKLDDLPPVVVASQDLAKQPLWLVAFKSYFSLRTEDAGKVIYHKHWFVLIQEAWQPLALALLLFIIQLWRFFHIWNSPELTFISKNFIPDTFVIAVFIFSLIDFAWFFWKYEDWKNDIFMVTNDQIFDIDKVPFGKEQKRAAQVESIMSTSYTREGIIANLFNYGTVKITVGGSQFDFQDVADPAGVQADINRRRIARIASKNENAGKEDRERFATWIAAYHENIDDFNKPIIAPTEQKKEEKK
jgi:CRP-like cAMP-binding protein